MVELKESLNYNMLTLLKKNSGYQKVKILLKKPVSLKKKRNLKKKKKKLNKYRKRIFFRKKKLDIYNICFNLKNRSFIFELRRRIFRKKISFVKLRKLLYFKLKLKQLFLKYTLPIKKKRKKKKLVLKPKNLQKNQKAKLKIKKRHRKLVLDINVQSNNIFVNLSMHLKKKIFKTIRFWSVGSFSLFCSKVKLKFTLSVLLKEVKFRLRKRKIYAIKIKAPRYLNKYILKQLKRLLFKPRFFIYISFKIFNGCRSKKKRRKKRLRFRCYR